MTSVALLRPTADECVFAECVSMIHMTPVMLVCLYWMRSLGGLDLALVQLYCLQIDLPLWSCVYHVVYCTIVDMFKYVHMCTGTCVSTLLHTPHTKLHLRLRSVMSLNCVDYMWIRLWLHLPVVADCRVGLTPLVILVLLVYLTGSMGSFPHVYLLKLLKYFITCCFQNNTDEVIQATILPALKTNCFEQAVKWLQVPVSMNV